jgi:hypothetical protein
MPQDAPVNTPGNRGDGRKPLTWIVRGESGASRASGRRRGHKSAMEEGEGGVHKNGVFLQTPFLVAR